MDGVLGTGSCCDIVDMVRAVLAGEKPSLCRNISAPLAELPRAVSTGPCWAYLRIAEGCDNRCAYCVIPSLRGRFRSRAMENVLAEARMLAEAGVKEIIVVAQDITRYGTDLYGRRCLAELLRELCKLDFRWVRLLHGHIHRAAFQLRQLLFHGRQGFLMLPDDHAPGVALLQGRELHVRLRGHDARPRLHVGPDRPLAQAFGKRLRLGLIVGNEGNGISDAVKAQATHRFRLPMRGEAESLNVAVAAGIMMYDLTKSLPD